jgi:hypothetical protein
MGHGETPAILLRHQNPTVIEGFLPESKTEVSSLGGARLHCSSCCSSTVRHRLYSAGPSLTLAL